MDFKAAFVKQAAMTTTENGAVALPETGSKVLDLFSSITRDAGEDDIIKVVEGAWEESPLGTLRCMFAKRDIRGEAGQGDRYTFVVFYRWLFKNHPQIASKNLQHISEYGYWKDLNKIGAAGEYALDEIYKLYARQLNRDLLDMQDNKPVSLAAKWIHSVNSKRAKDDKMTQRLAKWMILSKTKPDEHLRKYVITKLRNYIKIVETKMSQRNWDQIDYSQVPSIAMKRYRKAFTVNDGARFEKYLGDVKSGKAKINSQTLSPVDLVKEYANDNIENDVIELQWSDMISKGSTHGTDTSKILPICDVSGSMRGLPMCVSIGLGSYIAKVNKGFFKNLIVSFSDEPRMINMEGKDKLIDMVREFRNSDNIGYSTNLIKTFRLILNMALKDKIDPSQMPEMILLISDMEFNAALSADGYKQTSLDAIRELYEGVGYTFPKIVFWNVRTTKTVPCGSNEKGVNYIGGYSKNILSMLMNREFPSPMALLLSILYSSRYDRIQI